jgi:hypothetical protein
VIAMRRIGAALGATTGPLAGWGQAVTGAGDGHWYVWVLATVVGACLGAFGLPVFLVGSDTRDDGLTPWFGAAFTFAVGLLGGALVAFPMGAVVGSVGGVIAGGVGVFCWRLLGRRDDPARLAAVAVAGCTPAFLLAWGAFT